MAKTATVEAKEQPLATTTTQMPASTNAAAFEADAGAGAENVSSVDMTVPFIQCAQALSPQVNKRESAYIEGLEQGDFFNAATGQLWKGDTGFLFIPALYRRQCLEWKPNRGGFVAEHGPEMESEAVSEERDGRWGMFLPNGNTLSVHGTWYGLIVGEDGNGPSQAVLSLSSTQLKKSKQLTTKLLSRAVARSNGQGTFNPAFFYNVVKITSVPESNDRGNWFGWNMALHGDTISLPNGMALYESAKVMREAVRSGTVKAAPPPQTTGSQDGEIPF